MSTADWVVIAVIAVSALYGVVSGFIRGAFSLAGFVAGAYLGARLGPELLGEGSGYVPLVALAGAIVGGSLLSAIAGLLAGALRSTLRVVPGLRLFDALAGLALGTIAGVAFCWALGAVALYLPGQSDLRRAVQKSAILGRINESFPPERLLETLERVDPLGVLVGPPATVAPPDSKLGKDPDVVAAAKSVVRVTGIACGLGVEGSGWIARRGLVVTNAHVVAGVDRPQVDRRDGSSYPATVVAFNVENDIAVLRAAALPGAPLPLADPERGSPVMLAGYPGNGPLTLTAGRLGSTRRLLSRDAYGRGPVTRGITVLRGVIRPGSSGGPGIDARGRVRTTVFARRPGEQGGYGIPAEVVRAALRAAGRNAVPATDCTR